MVTEKISQVGNLFLTAGASAQTENKTKSQFADAMETAEKSYNTKSVGATEKTSAGDKDISEDTVSDTEQKAVKTEEKVTKSDSGEVKETPEKAETVDLEETEEVNPEAVSVVMQFTELVQQMQEQVQEQLAQELGVSLEAVQESMQELGFTAEDLQDPQNLLKLIVDVMDLQGPEEMLTNPQLTQAFKQLNQQIDEILSKVPTEEVAVAEELETEQVVVKNVSEETVQAETQEEQQEGQTAEKETNTDSQVQQPVQNLTSSMKMDIAQNIQELIADRVDYDTSVDIVRQVAEQVKFTMRSDVTSLEMQLYPEHLGKVAIQVVSKNGVLTAQIAAENEAAKVALESQIQLLKENFDQQGLKVESVEVMVSTKGFDQQKNGEGSSETEKQSKQFKGVQIADVQEEEDLTESEEIMETLGNTVSYMA